MSNSSHEILSDEHGVRSPHISDDSDTDDQENQALNYIEIFYDRNYKSRELMVSKAYGDTRIWNIVYDDIYDFGYVFVAKFERQNNHILQTTVEFEDEDAQPMGDMEFEAL